MNHSHKVAFRLRAIHELLLRHPRGIAKAQLLEYLNDMIEIEYGVGAGISNRQLEADISTLRELYDAPIPKYKRKYYFSDSGFRIPGFGLTETEKRKLRMLVGQLVRDWRQGQIRAIDAEVALKMLYLISLMLRVDDETYHYLHEQQNNYIQLAM